VTQLGNMARRADAVMVEIIRNGILATTGEMKTNLMRTAYNVIIYEALDFTVGLFDQEGNTVSIGLGLPMFIRGMATTVQAKIAHFGKQGIHPGDILITNDAYITGSHLNHITLTMPIFHDGELAAFACCMAHWLDVGGAIGQVTTEIYQEGLQIPILKYQSAGVVNQDLIDIIAMNVRMPTLALGDLRAQVTAVVTGERRFSQLLARYGRDSVSSAMTVLLDQAEAAARASTLSIPDGVYEAESYMDDDGVTLGVRIPIHVKVEVRGERMTIDLSAVAAQVGGFYNSGLATGIACAQVAYKCLTTPTLYPINEGCFRSLDVIIPSGTCISAERPAPMAWWMTYPMTVIDTIFKALAPAIPDRVIAGHYADLTTGLIHGLSPTTRKFFLAALTVPGGGWGAKSSEDGVSATICINDGDTHNVPVEQMESRYPVIVESYALRTDSGGAGKHRGGLGAELVFRARIDMSLSTTIERTKCRPWGLQGGKDALANEVRMQRGGVWEDTLPNGKLLGSRLRSGDRFVLAAGGGGGHGDPHLRDSTAVARDVSEGYVSAKAAREVYGVAIDPLTGGIDAAGTARLRAGVA
jgi:N-methylhydantoinase B